MPALAARRLKAAVRIAETPRAFSAAVRAALGGGEEALERRLSRIRFHSWGRRNVEEIQRISKRLATPRRMRRDAHGARRGTVTRKHDRCDGIVFARETDLAGSRLLRQKVAIKMRRSGEPQRGSPCSRCNLRGIIVMTPKRPAYEAGYDTPRANMFSVAELSILGEAVSALQRLRDHHMTKDATASAADLAVAAILLVLDGAR